MDDKELSDSMNNVSLIKGNPAVFFFYFCFYLFTYQYFPKHVQTELKWMTWHCFAGYGSYLTQLIILTMHEEKSLSHTSEECA